MKFCSFSFDRLFLISPLTDLKISSKLMSFLPLGEKLSVVSQAKFLTVFEGKSFLRLMGTEILTKFSIGFSSALIAA